MPVTPEEASVNRTVNNQPTIDDLCKRVDKLLCESAPNSQGQWWFNVASLSQAVRASLLDIYRDTHWKVGIIHDHRDGDAMVFEKL